MPPKLSNPPTKDFDEAIQATNLHIDDAIRATHQQIDERFQTSNQQLDERFQNSTEHLESQLRLMQTKLDNKDQIHAGRHESLKTYLTDLFKPVTLST